MHAPNQRVVRKKAASLLRKAKAALSSPVGAVLGVCCCTCLYGAASTFMGPPFGANAGADGPECAGAGFEHLGFCICPRETVCVKDAKGLTFLVLARLSAYFDYPLYVLLFVSKAHNLRGVLQRTYLSEVLPLDDLHQLHVFAGALVGLEVFWHSLWHLLRWALAGELYLLWEHVTGVSGLVSLSVTPLIVAPMRCEPLRTRMPFGWRKAAHYLSAVWGVAICFHAPERHIAIVMGTAVCVYALDWLYGFFFKIYRVPTLLLTRLGSAVEVVWEHPKGFESDGTGYIYLCLPWISRAEWHAFSLVLHPTQPGRSCVCMAAVGDWTRAVHAALAKPSARPGWVYGPFPSPFSTAMGYDNIIAVASGIGITPSISTIVNLGSSRKVHLIWMCRDADLVEFYMSKIAFDDDAWSFVCYTGKRELVLGARPANPRVKVLLSRPNLEELILGLIDFESCGAPMPQQLMERVRESEGRIYNKSATARFCDALERTMTSYSAAEMYRIAIDNSEPVDGAPPPEMSLKGFIAMVRTLCHVEGGLTDEELAAYFAAADKNGNRGLDLAELEAILGSLRRAADPEDRESSEEAAASAKEKAVAGQRRASTPTVREASVKERREMLDGWQMLYCGGAAPVVRTLRKIQRKYQLPLKVESFAW